MHPQRRLVRQLLDRGWYVDRRTGSGHTKLMHPSGRAHIIVSSSPSDSWRGWRNLRAEARRIEAEHDNVPRPVGRHEPRKR